MPLLQEKRQEEIPTISSPRPSPIVLPGGAERKQRHQMLIALVLLLIALALVIVKDREFWFPSAPVVGSAISTEQNTTKTLPVIKSTPAATTKPVTKAKKQIKAPAISAPASGMNSVVTSRAVLPPLEVEVVAGNQHSTINPGSNSIKIDVQPEAASSSAASSAGPAPKVSESVSLSADTVRAVARPVRPAYPMLAKQMRVQGSVVLEALIGKNGDIQDLHILSGPDILSSAAMEAVRQWRFKPYYQNGQPVETEAHITVNFTISTY